MKIQGTIYTSDDGLRQAFVMRGNVCKTKRFRGGDVLPGCDTDKRGWDVLLFEMTTPLDRDNARHRYPSLGKGKHCGCTTCVRYPDGDWKGRVSLTFGEGRALAKEVIEAYEQGL